MNECFIDVGSAHVQRTVRSWTSLGGKGAVGNVSLVESNGSSSLRLLERETTKKSRRKVGHDPTATKIVQELLLGTLSGSINTKIRLNYKGGKKAS